MSGIRDAMAGRAPGQGRMGMTGVVGVLVSLLVCNLSGRPSCKLWAFIAAV